MVGVALWPGAVEKAFRQAARLVEERGFNKSEVMELVAQFGVTWYSSAGQREHGCQPNCKSAAMSELLGKLPDEPAMANAARGREWL